MLNGRQICVVSELALDLRRIEALVVDPQSRPIQGAAVGLGSPLRSLRIRPNAHRSERPLRRDCGSRRRRRLCRSPCTKMVSTAADRWAQIGSGQANARCDDAGAALSSARERSGSNPLPFAFVGIRWRDGRSEALVSYVGDHQGYAEVYAPRGGEDRGTGGGRLGQFGRTSSTRPTATSLSKVEASPPDEVSGVIEPPPDSQRSGPYLVTLNSSRGRASAWSWPS